MAWLDSGDIQAIAGVIQAIGIIFAVQQVRVGMRQVAEQQRQITADHDLARRSRAVDDVREYANSLDKFRPAARRLVDEFTPQQIQWLVTRTPFAIDESNKKIAEYALGEILDKHPLVFTEGKVKLDEAHLAHLLILCVGFLNNLETALLGWSNGISDKEIIQTQFRYVVSAYHEHYILEKLRAHEKLKNNYPAIAKFVAFIKEPPPVEPERGHVDG